MISASDRRKAVTLIRYTCRKGARLEKACEVVGISIRTYQRWTKPDTLPPDGRTTAKRQHPTNRLSEQERQEILAICNEQEHSSLPPSQIVPKLADEGRYIASESSFYRILREAKQSTHRGRAKAPHGSKPLKSHCATAPNQVWSWDITFLRSQVAGIFFRLYLILDIYSRKIVGWEIFEEERAEHAASLISKACLAEGIGRDQLVLHSDNGSPMKGAKMLTTLQRLGVVPSFSRPSVSDDNAYSESLFRTLKYTPSYPEKPFEKVDDARNWVHRFVTWYNHVHKHSGIKFVTPHQRHTGKDIEILSSRTKVYEEAKHKKPSRWSRSTRNWTPETEVWLNPTSSENDNVLEQSA